MDDDVEKLLNSLDTTNIDTTDEGNRFLIFLFFLFDFLIFLKSLNIQDTQSNFKLQNFLILFF